MSKLSLARLEEILLSIKKVKAMVIGDFALDAYWYADMTRSELSRETPHYTRPVVKESYSPGASGNICCNVKDIGAKDVFALSIIGTDWRGKILMDELENKGINTKGLIASANRVTPTYIKPIICGFDSQQEEARFDFVNSDTLTKSLEDQLIKKIESIVDEIDTVIIEDQIDNGVVTDRIREVLINLATLYAEKVFVVDSRERIGFFSNMVLKPNRMEAVKAVNPSLDYKHFNVETLAKVGKELQMRAKRPVYITMSEQGALLVTESAHYHLPAVPMKPPIDPVGAGDTFISAIGTALSAGADPVEAGMIANLAAAVVVKKLNVTGTATPEELIAKFEEVKNSEVWP
jgi:rfaE bifunctional protein kinase chain/domain